MRLIYSLLEPNKLPQTLYNLGCCLERSNIYPSFNEYICVKLADVISVAPPCMTYTLLHRLPSAPWEHTIIWPCNVIHRVPPPQKTWNTTCSRSERHNITCTQATQHSPGAAQKIWGLWCQKQISQAGLSNCIPLVSDPGMHHGTCVTHVPWCMSGSLTSGCNYLSLPEICASDIKIYIYISSRPWWLHWPVLIRKLTQVELNRHWHSIAVKLNFC